MFFSLLIVLQKYAMYNYDLCQAQMLDVLDTRDHRAIRIGDYWQSLKMKIHRNIGHTPQYICVQIDILLSACEDYRAVIYN